MCMRVICLVIVCTLGLAHTACAGGLVGWWKLDETSGITVSDSSGSGITGAFVGAPKWAAGTLGGALEFDGASAVDFGNPPQAGMTGPMAIALWINPANLGTILAQSGHDRAFFARYRHYVFKASGRYLRFTTPGVRDHNALNTVLKVGEWQHVAVTFQPNTPDGCVFYLNGVETDRVAASAYNAAAATSIGPVLLGNCEFAGQFYTGLFDDVQLYDRELTAARIQEIFAGGCAQLQKAEKPDPADGAAGVAQGLLQWTPGAGALLHNVYVGASPELTQADQMGVNLPFAMYFHVAPLQPGIVYYWRVDEVDAAGAVTPGDVWSFTALPATAWAPQPGDGASYVPATTTLAWTAAPSAVAHDVYLGTDQAAVEAGVAATKKAEKLDVASYAATDLERGQTYYWRVDEVLADGGKVPGPIWSFTVRPVFAQTDPSLVGWWKLDDEGAGVAVDSSGYDNYGTLQGRVKFVEGHLGDALLFDDVDDWVDCGNDASLANVDSVSVAAWIVRYRTGGDRKIASNQNNKTGGYKLGVYSNNKVEFEIRSATNASTSNRNVAEGTVLDAEVWYHVVGVYEKGKAIRTYVNGKLDRELATANVAGVSDGVFRIGRESYSNANRWIGRIDDVRVYNKALTEAEIQQLTEGN